MVVEAPLIAKSRKPGNFVIVRVGEKGERMPLTISDADPVKGTITLVIQKMGVSSTKLCNLEEGEYITDLVGPLGKATHIEKVGTVLACGGGVGVAPLLPIIRAFKVVLTALTLLAVTALTSVLGSLFGFLIPLAIVLFILIVLHPYAPKVLNNVGFAYLTCACIDTTAFATHIPLFFGTFIVGSLIFNGVCILLMKPAQALAVKTVTKAENAAT